MKHFIRTGLSVAGLVIASTLAANADQLYGADFMVHNDTGSVIDVLSVTPTYQTYIESKDYIHPSDEPGGDLNLRPYSWIKINMHGDACVYNIVAHFRDGSDSHKYDVDLCHTRTFTFY